MSEVERVEIGDTFTILGVHRQIPNPERRWWQFWKPRMVATRELQTFTVRAFLEGEG